MNHAGKEIGISKEWKGFFRTLWKNLDLKLFLNGQFLWFDVGISEPDAYADGGPLPPVPQNRLCQEKVGSANVLGLCEGYFQSPDTLPGRAVANFLCVFSIQGNNNLPDFFHVAPIVRPNVPWKR